MKYIYSITLFFSFFILSGCTGGSLSLPQKAKVQDRSFIPTSKGFMDIYAQPDNNLYFNDILPNKDGFYTVGVTYDKRYLKNSREFGMHSIFSFFDKKGELKWYKSFYGTHTLQLSKIIKSQDGILITGNNFDYANKSAVAVFNVDKEGKVLWKQNITNKKSLLINDVELLDDNTYLLSGYSVKGNFLNPYIIKLDKNGDIIFQKEFQSNKNSYKTCNAK